VRGSGRAADLIGDAVFLKFGEKHPCHVTAIEQDIKQRKLHRFLFPDLAKAGCAVEPFAVGEESAEEGVMLKNKDCWDFAKAAKGIEDLNREECLPDPDDTLKAGKLLELRARAVKLLEEVYGFTNLKKETKGEHALKVLSKVLRAAGTDKCWVFDLLSTEPGRDDFNGALLKCLLNGIQTAGKESKESLWKKLKYTMLWNRWVWPVGAWSRLHVKRVAVAWIRCVEGCGVRVAAGSCALQ
jgi:hypothetical protein